MKAFVLALTVMAQTFLAVGPAIAGDGHVEPGDDDFNAVIEHVHIGSLGGGGQGPSGAIDVVADDAPSPCDVHEVCSDLVCESNERSPLGGILVYYDGGPGLNLGWCDPGGGPVAISPGMVAAAFRRIPLPPSVLVVQPAGGRTLVNFATNFYTESGPFARTVVLLGQRVELRIWPSRFGWVFGDGASLATSSAGAPFPDLEVTHDYRRSGWVGPRVDTTYAARFRVGEGLWRAVPGSVTIAGVPVDLEVVTARPVLVAAR